MKHEKSIEDLKAELSAIARTVANEFACDHKSLTLYYQTCANGTRQYRQRCTACHQIVGKSALAMAEVAAMKQQAVEWEPRLLDARREKQDRRAKELRASIEQEIYHLWELRKLDRKSEYSQYLLTAKWQSKRQRALERDGFRCQACLIRPATQVHHKTYERIFNEPLFDLVSVCETCHAALHVDAAEPVGQSEENP